MPISCLSATSSDRFNMPVCELHEVSSLQCALHEAGEINRRKEVLKALVMEAAMTTEQLAVASMHFNRLLIPYSKPADGRALFLRKPPHINV